MRAKAIHEPGHEARLRDLPEPLLIYLAFEPKLQMSSDAALMSSHPPKKSPPHPNHRFS